MFSQNDATEGVELVQEQMGPYTMWARKGYNRARSLLSHEKHALDAHQSLLAEKAEHRSLHCWYPECAYAPIAHIRQIGFDMKDANADFGHAQVDSSDFDGPVPGFCVAHVSQGPRELAQIVYSTHPAVQWGYLARRWFVRFTDGTAQGGMILPTGTVIQ